ncbi:MAG: M56 family metallopeptidase [Lachnospiraceae bacterium]|nr:M56 family metallopeptidase [Lachnospiraceae bacterium]
MSEVFLHVFNLSIAASWLVLCVILLRLVLRRAPKWIRTVLWGLVGLRLVLPFSIESVLSLIPSGETISPEILYAKTPAIESGIPVVNAMVNPVLSGSFSPADGDSVNPLQIWISIAAVIWIVGMAVMLLYTVISYVRLSIRIRAAVLLRDNIYQSEYVFSPFVMGLFRPRIYLPFHLSEKTMGNVIAHEQAHIRRYDHMIKPVAYFLLNIYWFNPVLWVAYILLCRDMELACDEQVIRGLDRERRADYSQALLSCSTTHRSMSACPLAFGEIGVKERVKNILNYKKPGFWIIVVAVIASLAVAVCFLTNPKSRATMKWAQTLDVQDVDSIELVVMPQSEDKQYRSFAKDEFAGVVARINESRGTYVANPHSIAGQTMTFYIRTSDGVEHKIMNSGNVYLVIDDECYDADYSWMDTWSRDYGEGNAALPGDFFSQGLTLDDVTALAKKGNALNWVDFDGYDYTETGSGLYIRVYKIDAIFSLWIGGGSTTEEPMYIRLSAGDQNDDYIDIRTEDVASFIAQHQESTSVSTSGGFEEPPQITESTDDSLDAASDIG